MSKCVLLLSKASEDKQTQYAVPLAETAGPPYITLHAHSFERISIPNSFT